MLPDNNIEISLHGYSCGIDEAGRGSWAGPVVAAAVILDKKHSLTEGINDSKKLSKEKRELLFRHINKVAISVGIGISTVEEIYELNILNATKVAMRRAFSQLNPKPDNALIDGNQLPEIPCKEYAIIKGDEKSISIAAASIIAKVSRDMLMTELSKDFPEYKWEKNYAYGTKEHIEAIRKSGITKHHRKKFKPIAKFLENKFSVQESYEY